MKQLTESSELIGKTITRIGQYEKIVALFYEGNEYAIFTYDSFSEGVYLMFESYSLIPTQYNCYELKQLGVIDEAEYMKLLEGYQEKRKLDAEKREIEQYQMLKKKYEI